MKSLRIEYYGRTMSGFVASALVAAALAGPAAVADAVPGASPASSALAGQLLATAAATSADRIGGADRYATAAQVSAAGFAAGASTVFLASGADYPDALSAAPIAASLSAPVLLTAPAALPAVVVAELRRLGAIDVIIVGGTGVITRAVEAQLKQLGYTTDRIGGADRYDTSRQLIAEFAEPSTILYLATGRNYPDALAAAAAAGSAGAPVLLVDGNRSILDPASLALLSDRGVQSVLIAGGTAVVSAAIQQQLTGLVPAVRRLAGSDRYSTAVAINTYAFPAATRAFVATGGGFADALTGSVLAGVGKAPLYLSKLHCLPRVIRSDMLVRLQVARVTLLGGTGVLGSRVAALDECTGATEERAGSEARLTAALQLKLRMLPGTYSVSVRELEGVQASVNIRGSVMQEPVSVIKLFVVYAVLERIDRGLLSFTTPTRSGVSVRECIRVSIHVSDNNCHWDLVALVGAQALNNQFWVEGYRGTVYAGRSGGGTLYSSKQATTADFALLLSRLYRGELLSPALTEHFITLLETQLWRSKLPSGVEVGVAVGNKTGSLWSSAGWFHSDAGVISAPGGMYAIAVLGRSGATSAGVREIGRVVYEHFNGAIGTRAAWSDLNSVTTSAITYYRFGSASTPLGVIPAGTRIETYASSRTWYRVIYQGNHVYVHSPGLRNYFAYPRSAR